MTTIYSVQPMNFLNVGSEYKISGNIFTSSGGPIFRAEITNSAVNSYLHSFQFNGELNKWTEFQNIFTASLAMSGGLFRMTLISSGSFNCYFDDILIVDYKNMIALGVLQIYPEWNMQRQTAQNRGTYRTKGGKVYSYKFGNYKEFKFNLDYVQNSKAAEINSWWATDALIHFKIYSAGVWEVNCCHLINNISPFDESEKPYHQYRSGILELETY